MNRPTDLPEYMTWEELEQLPEEIAEQIELWNGRVVWVQCLPAEHQAFTNCLWSGLRRNIPAYREQCWRVGGSTSIFFGRTGKSDFITPDFMIYRCLDKPYQDVRSGGVLLVGEVLAPSNSDADMELRKARYADAGIRWYWEVTLATHQSAIAHVHAYALATEVNSLPPGVRAPRELHPDRQVVTQRFRRYHDRLPIPHHHPLVRTRILNRSTGIDSLVNRMVWETGPVRPRADRRRRLRSLGHHPFCSPNR